MNLKNPNNCFKVETEFLKQVKETEVRMFLETGKIKKGASPEKIILEVEKILSKKWKREAIKSNQPIYTFKEMIEGVPRAREENEEIKKQVMFVVKKFCKKKHGELKKISKKVLSHFSRKSISIRAVLRENSQEKNFSKEALRNIRKEAIELYKFFEQSHGLSSKEEKKGGRIYWGMMNEYTGMVFLAKNWTNHKEAMTTPIHETVHVLQRIGKIKKDVPFAQAVDRLYGLERGFFAEETQYAQIGRTQLNPKIRIKKIKEIPGVVYDEPQRTDELGKKIGQWVYANVSKEKRWEYLFYRCMNLTHEDALEKMKKKEVCKRTQKKNEK
jgi:hypothetical protein